MAFSRGIWTRQTRQTRLTLRTYVTQFCAVTDFRGQLRKERNHCERKADSAAFGAGSVTGRPLIAARAFNVKILTNNMMGWLRSIFFADVA